MTDATSRYVPPDEKRSIIENAILAFRPNVASDYRWNPPPKVPQAQQALADLAAATNIPRLVKHRRLIDGLRRSTARNRARLHDPARAVLASTLEQGLPQDRHDSLLDQAKGQLDEAAAAQGTQRIQPQHSRQWVQGTNEIFPFTTHERTFEACNDQQQVPKPTPDGQVVERAHHRRVLERSAAGCLPHVCRSTELAAMQPVLEIDGAVAARRPDGGRL